MGHSYKLVNVSINVTDFEKVKKRNNNKNNRFLEGKQIKKNTEEPD